MTRHDDLVRLRHMLDFARKAVAHCQGRTRRDLDDDELLALAIDHPGLNGVRFLKAGFEGQSLGRPHHARPSGLSDRRIQPVGHEVRVKIAVAVGRPRAAESPSYTCSIERPDSLAGWLS